MFIVCMFMSAISVFCLYKLKEYRDELREYQGVITRQNIDIGEYQTEINEFVQTLSREPPIRCIIVIHRINRCITARRRD